MKLSVFTVGTPDISVENLPSRLKAYGYDGIEWRIAKRQDAPPNPVPPKGQWYWTYNQATLNLANVVEEAKWAHELTTQAGLEVASLSTYLQPGQPAEIEKVMQAAQVIGCPKIRLMPPGYNGETYYRDLFETAQRQISELIPLTEKYGVKLIFEIHHGNIIPSASAAYRLVSPFPANSVGVIFDPGNMVHEGFEEYQLGIELLGEYLDHVHIKDARPVFNPESKKWSVEWASVGEGMVNFARLIQALKKVGYSGYLSTEDFSNDRDTEGKLAHNISYLRELLQD